MHHLRLLGLAAMRLPMRLRCRSVLMPLHHELTLLRAQAALLSRRAGLQTGMHFRAASAGAPEGCFNMAIGRVWSAAAP